MRTMLIVIGAKLIMLALLCLAVVLASYLTRLIPEGRLKDYLTKPRRVHPITEEDRRDWNPVLWPLGLGLILWVIIWLSDPVGH
jgi:hypothetical protein